MRSQMKHPRLRMLLILGVSVCAVVVAWADDPMASASQGPAQAVTCLGTPNLLFLSPQLASSGSPEGAEAFDRLAALGVRTIISVDGKKPDVQAAAAAGIRYVHLPIGYDGISPQQQARLIKAVQSLPGPIVIHCHHGHHRAPAALAVVGKAVLGLSTDQALAFMKQAGTSEQYSGLYRAARELPVPDDRTLAETSDEFPAAMETSDMVDAMVRIEETWDRLKMIADADFSKPANHPDLDPRHEALMLAEHYRELQRSPAADEYGPQFLQLLQRSEQHAATLTESLRRDQRTSATVLMRKLGQSCKDCHNQFRDRAPR